MFEVRSGRSHQLVFGGGCGCFECLVLGVNVLVGHVVHGILRVEGFQIFQSDVTTLLHLLKSFPEFEEKNQQRYGSVVIHLFHLPIYSLQ